MGYCQSGVSWFAESMKILEAWSRSWRCLILGILGTVQVSADEAATRQLNDVHSRLNPTQVHRVIRADSTAAVVDAVKQAKK